MNERLTADQLTTISLALAIFSDLQNETAPEGLYRVAG
jgi:hypothetical protein